MQKSRTIPFAGAKTLVTAVLTMLPATILGSHLIAQPQCHDITIPEGADAATVFGDSGNGPRCFEFTPGNDRAGTIEIVEGNGTLVIEGVAADVKRHDFEAGPWTYYLTVTPEPIGSAGGPFTMQVVLR